MHRNGRALIATVIAAFTIRYIGAATNLTFFARQLERVRHEITRLAHERPAA
jgi:hypothetical protein